MTGEVLDLSPRRGLRFFGQLRVQFKIGVASVGLTMLDRRPVRLDVRQFALSYQSSISAPVNNAFC